MTGLDNTLPPTPLSEKLSLVMHHHLLTRVPVKLDLDDWNYRQWDFFFVQLCESYDVDKYLCTPTTTLAQALRPLSHPKNSRILVARPKSVKEAWSLISDIVKDNKRSHTNTLKAEL
ncbi:hypothetical protein Tco_0817396, partial [Tanacetum coccineum]